jgi:hypothetical protein
MMLSQRCWCNRWNEYLPLIAPDKNLKKIWLPRFHCINHSWHNYSFEKKFENCFFIYKKIWLHTYLLFLLATRVLTLQSLFDWLPCSSVIFWLAIVYKRSFSGWMDTPNILSSKIWQPLQSIRSQSVSWRMLKTVYIVRDPWISRIGAAQVRAHSYKEISKPNNPQYIYVQTL